MDKKEFIKLFYRFLKEEGVYYFIRQRIMSPEHYAERLRNNPNFSHFYTCRHYKGGVDSFLARVNTHGIYCIFTARHILPFEYSEISYVNFIEISLRWVSKLKTLEVKCTTKINLNCAKL